MLLSVVPKTLTNPTFKTYLRSHAKWKAANVLILFRKYRLVETRNVACAPLTPKAFPLFQGAKVGRWDINRAGNLSPLARTRAWLIFRETPGVWLPDKLIWVQFTNIISFNVHLLQWVTLMHAMTMQGCKLQNSCDWKGQERKRNSGNFPE